MNQSEFTAEVEAIALKCDALSKRVREEAGHALTLDYVQAIGAFSTVLVVLGFIIEMDPHDEPRIVVPR